MPLLVFSIMGSNLKKVFAMVVTIFWWCLNISEITIITVKSIDYWCIIYDINKSDAIRLLENSAYKMHIKEINIKNSFEVSFLLSNQSKKNKNKKLF